MILNLVHPETGHVGDLSYCKRKLQAWALEYEREGGKIYCDEREKNAQRRERGEVTKYQDERLLDAKRITELYQQSDTGSAFVAALQDAGYILALGDKGRLVLVDEAGKVQNLVRQIDGVKKKDIEARFADVIPLLPTVAKAVARQEVLQQEHKRASHDTDAAVIEKGKTILAVHQAVVAAVVDVAKDPLAEHQTHVQKHKAWQKDETAEHEALQWQHMQQEKPQDVMRPQVAHQTVVGDYSKASDYPKIIISRLAEHMQTAKSHVKRFATWLHTKPKEYIASMKKRHRSSEHSVSPPDMALEKIEQRHDKPHKRETSGKGFER